MRVPSLVFCGRDGGSAKAVAAHFIIVPGKATSTIQEPHIVLAYTLCNALK